jgi:hypothetical protein
VRTARQLSRRREERRKSGTERGQRQDKRDHMVKRGGRMRARRLDEEGEEAER